MLIALCYGAFTQFIGLFFLSQLSRLELISTDRGLGMGWRSIKYAIIINPLPLTGRESLTNLNQPSNGRQWRPQCGRQRWR